MLFQTAGPIPWMKFLTCVPLYALGVAHFTVNFGYYTLLTCLPQYFKHILHFDIKSVRAQDHSVNRTVRIHEVPRRTTQGRFRRLRKVLGTAEQSCHSLFLPLWAAYMPNLPTSEHFFVHLKLALFSHMKQYLNILLCYFTKVHSNFCTASTKK